MRQEKDHVPLFVWVWKSDNRRRRRQRRAVQYTSNVWAGMGCQISKEEDENSDDRQSNTENGSETMANNANTAGIDYKSRLEWKICLVCAFNHWQLTFAFAKLSEKNVMKIIVVFVFCRPKIHPSPNLIYPIAI